MAITVTLSSSTVQDATLYFDVIIDGEICATVSRSLTNATLKEVITAAYDRGVTVATATLKYDSALDDA